MTHGSLFSGIGGFDLAAEWMGWTNVFHCEMNPFGQRVLAHHFPNSKLHEDVKTFPSSDYVGRIDILTGGFPCQPYSNAGKRLGKDDDRHLWPFMLDIIRTIRPRYVVGENVRGLVNWNDGMVFDEVQTDLELAGYEVLPFVLPACGVGAPHRRDRVWFVAYANGSNTGNHRGADEKKAREVRRQKTCDVPDEFCGDGYAANADNGSRPRNAVRAGREEFTMSPWAEFPTQPPICGGNDGLPTELDGITFPKWRNESIKAYGNAIVPQVAYQIFQAIAATDENTTERFFYHSRNERNG